MPGEIQTITVHVAYCPSQWALKEELQTFSVKVMVAPHTARGYKYRVDSAMTPDTIDGFCANRASLGALRRAVRQGILTELGVSEHEVKGIKYIKGLEGQGEL